MKKYAVLMAFLLMAFFNTKAQTTISIGDVSSQIGSNVVIPISVTNFNNIGSVSLQINFNGSVLEFVETANSKLVNVLTGKGPGYIRLGWYSSDPVNLGDTKLIDLVFQYNGGTSTVSFDQSVQTEIRNDAGVKLPIVYTDGSVTEFTGLDAPALIAPANGATDQNLSLQLDWSDVTDATSYDVQVSTLSTFATQIINQTDLTESDYTIGSGVLSNSKTYYWRAKGKNNSTDGKWSGTYNFTTISASAINVTVKVDSVTAFPDTRISVPINVENFDQVDAITLRLNFDNTKLTYVGTENEVKNDMLVNVTDDLINIAWIDMSTTNPLTIESGKLIDLIFDYTSTNTSISFNTNDCEISSRVNLLNVTYVNGTVIESDPMPTIPELSAPADEAVDVSLTPVLTWNAASMALTYSVQVSTDTTFNTLVVDETGVGATQLSLTTPLERLTKYYWRVSATNNVGSSLWSDTWSFTTLNPPLAVPTLSTPATGSVDVSLTPSLDWADVEEVTSYRLQVSTAAGFAVLVGDYTGLTGSAYTVLADVLSESTKYYWRVNATDGTRISGWSSTSDFTTLTIPLPVPVLSEPANNSLNVSLTSKLNWNDVPNATAYALQVSTSETFATSIIEQNAVAVSEYTVPKDILSYETKYYWRVKAKTASKESDWSASWNFTTELGELPAPGLIAPANGATNVKVDLTLDWNNVPSATGYGLQIDDDETFTSLSIDATNLTESTYSIPSGILSTGTTYYWRVNASDATRTSVWSEVRNFKTEGPNDVQTFMSGIPDQFGLFQNYPNPFNPSTKIRYSLPEASQVKIEIVDLLGRTVAQLMNEFQSAGYYEFDWNAKNLTSGTYIYRLNAKAESGKVFSEMKKMMFIK